MSQKKGVRAGADGPAVVFGERNLDHVPRTASPLSTVEGSPESATSDFLSHDQDDYPVLHHAQSYFSTTPFPEETIGDGDMTTQDLMDDHVDALRSDVSDTVSEWLDNAIEDDGEDKIVLIEGTRMGWRQQSGWKFVNADDFADDPVHHIAPNTMDYTQNWSNDGGTLTASQSHHDSSGESYVFSVLSRSEAADDERYQRQMDYSF